MINKTEKHSIFHIYILLTLFYKHSHCWLETFFSLCNLVDANDYQQGCITQNYFDITGQNILQPEGTYTCEKLDSKIVCLCKVDQCNTMANSHYWLGETELWK